MEKEREYDPDRDLPPERDVPDARTEPIPMRETGTGSLMDYRHRFDELQAQFIDEPRAAVEKAEKLVDEAVNALLGSMRERMQRLHKDYDGDSKDTERLRLAMRGYRELMDSLTDRSAA